MRSAPGSNAATAGVWPSLVLSSSADCLCVDAVWGCLVQVSSNDDCSSTVLTSCVTVTLTAGTTYAFQVDGFNSAFGTVSIVVQ